MKWKVAYVPNCEYRGRSIKSIDDINNAGFDVIDASVPGNFELDLMKAGKLKDLYFSTNTLKAQKTENFHLWYFTTFQADNKNSYLHFNGIDTIADIYINGMLVKSTDNMFMEYDVYADLNIGNNELVVHIKPVCIEARKYTIPASSCALKYNYQTLYVRKAPHMFGWDIMPRIVSAGIWKNVEIRDMKKDKINEVFFVTNKIDFSQNKALMQFYINVDANGDFITDYSVRICGVCGDSSFRCEQRLWHNSYQFSFTIDNCRLWWPKNSGEQNLYDTTVELLYKGNVCDKYKLNIGVRTIKLDRTDFTDKNGNGEFCFEVNGKKIFVLGTNWVPLDAFHSNDCNRMERALELLDDVGCNMVRCWGGNIYEPDEFFDFCDHHGIMVWQDFALGCAIYPQEESFVNKIEEEAIYQIKRLRNHSSLVIWAGDNEGDLVYVNRYRDPNTNIITRDVLRKAMNAHDYSRPYLPSSPFVSEKAYNGGHILPEEHLWGPRDYFKGEFYKNSECHFASETGYHGFPAPNTLKRFLKNPEQVFEEGFKPTDEYLVHASSMETSIDAPYSYRIKLAYDQVVTLFGKAEEKFEDFIRQSQITQAEAKKYFIEKFRLTKWRRTGIIWWNLLDGWPQVSDAVVDYYFTKKLAYHYIKRSQSPVCFMFDEPDGNIMNLYGVNDFPYDTETEYSVINISNNKEVLKGKTVLKADSSERIGSVKIKNREKCFYLIKWTINGKEYKNHYYTNIINIDYNRYMEEIKKCGFDEFEDFI